MENNNSKKSFSVNEVERRTGFSPLTIKELAGEGVTEIMINSLGRIVVNKGDKLIMWDAPATPAGKLAAQRAILSWGLRLTGRGVLPLIQGEMVKKEVEAKAAPKKPETPPAAEPVEPPAPKGPKGPKKPRGGKKTVKIEEVKSE